MANIKITQLNEGTTLQDNDVIPYVDVINDETKKIKVSNILTNIANKRIVKLSGTTPNFDYNGGSVLLPYPQGFTIQNSIVIAARTRLVFPESQEGNYWIQGSGELTGTTSSDEVVTYGGYGYDESSFGITWGVTLLPRKASSNNPWIGGYAKCEIYLMRID